MQQTFNTVIGELDAAAVVACLVLALLGFSEALRRLGASSEVTRKTAHIGSGLITLTFPHLFDATATVFVLASGFLIIMVAGKLLGGLRGVHGVRRDTVGAYAFPVVVAVLFWASGDSGILYTIPILVLTFSDAVAALIGKEYGKAHYHAVGETRTIEGSAAFFIAAFISVHVPLLLSGQTGRLEAVLISVVVATLVTCFEALSVKGLDNVFVPVGTYVVLSHVINAPVIALWERMALIGVLASLGWLFSRTRVMTHTGALGIFLAAYGAYMLGGPAWFWPLPVLFLFLFWIALRLKLRRPETPPLGLSAVFHVAFAGVVCYFLYDVYETPLLFVGYITSISAGGAVIVATLAERTILKKPDPKLCFPRTAQGLLGGAVAALLPLPAALLAGPPSPISATHLLVAVACSPIALLLISRLSRTAALFECPVCGEIEQASRHCGECGTLHAGNRLWTRNRLALIAIGVAACIAAVSTGAFVPIDRVARQTTTAQRTPRGADTDTTTTTHTP